MGCDLKNSSPPSYYNALQLPKPCPEGKFLKGNPQKCKKFGDLTKDECEGNYLYWNTTANKCRYAPPPQPLPTKLKNTTLVHAKPIAHMIPIVQSKPISQPIAPGTPIVQGVPTRQVDYGRKKY